MMSKLPHLPSPSPPHTPPRNGPNDVEVAAQRLPLLVQIGGGLFGERHLSGLGHTRGIVTQRQALGLELGDVNVAADPGSVGASVVKLSLEVVLAALEKVACDGSSGNVMSEGDGSA